MRIKYFKKIQYPMLALIFVAIFLLAPDITRADTYPDVTEVLVRAGNIIKISGTALPNAHIKTVKLCQTYSTSGSDGYCSSPWYEVIRPEDNLHANIFGAWVINGLNIGVLSSPGSNPLYTTISIAAEVNTSGKVRVCPNCEINDEPLDFPLWFSSEIDLDYNTYLNQASVYYYAAGMNFISVGVADGPQGPGGGGFQYDEDTEVFDFRYPGQPDTQYAREFCNYTGCDRPSPWVPVDTMLGGFGNKEFEYIQALGIGSFYGAVLISSEAANRPAIPLLTFDINVNINITGEIGITFDADIGFCSIIPSKEGKLSEENLFVNMLIFASPAIIAVGYRRKYRRNKRKI